jgi:hypothetical protein
LGFDSLIVSEIPPLFEEFRGAATTVSLLGDFIAAATAARTLWV